MSERPQQHPPETNDHTGAVHRRIRFEGRVQGVGFRMTTASIVNRHAGLTGWVRNDSDGSVLMHVQGAPADVDAALADIRERFRRNIVNEHASEEAPDPSLTSFEIRH
jgi:acylphosphatase